MRTDGDTGLGLIIKAMEQERDDRIFQQWVAQLPWMGRENFVSFADYKDRVTGANIDRRSVAEIMKDLDAVEQELQRGGDS
jgi:hypothetical protein